MKSGVLIVLVLCGTVLIGAPSIMDHFREHNDLLLGNGERLAFWLTGAMMILGGIVGGLMGGRHEVPK